MQVPQFCLQVSYIQKIHFCIAYRVVPLVALITSTKTQSTVGSKLSKNSREVKNSNMKRPQCINLTLESYLVELQNDSCIYKSVNIKGIKDL